MEAYLLLSPLVSVSETDPKMHTLHSFSISLDESFLFCVIVEFFGDVFNGAKMVQKKNVLNQEQFDLQ